MKFASVYAFMCLEERCISARLSKRIETFLLVDISGCRTIWWVTADGVLQTASLVNADVINVHFGWEYHVREVLGLEASCGECHQIRVRHCRSTTYETFPGS